MANTIIKKTIDISGVPFVVEKRDDGKYYIVAIRVRSREFFFDSTGLPVEIVDKITGTAGDGKINGIKEIEDFLENIPEGSMLEEEITLDDIQQDIEETLGIPLDDTGEEESPSV